MTMFLLSEAPPEMNADNFRRLCLRGCDCDPMIFTDDIEVTRVEHVPGCGRGAYINEWAEGH